MRVSTLPARRRPVARGCSSDRAPCARPFASASAHPEQPRQRARPLEDRLRDDLEVRGLDSSGAHPDLRRSFAGGYFYGAGHQDVGRDDREVVRSFPRRMRAIFPRRRARDRSRIRSTVRAPAKSCILACRSSASAGPSQAFSAARTPARALRNRTAPGCVGSPPRRRAREERRKQGEDAGGGACTPSAEIFAACPSRSPPRQLISHHENPVGGSWRESSWCRRPKSRRHAADRSSAAIDIHACPPDNRTGGFRSENAGTGQRVEAVFDGVIVVVDDEDPANRRGGVK